MPWAILKDDQKQLAGFTLRMTLLIFFGTWNSVHFDWSSRDGL